VSTATTAERKRLAKRENNRRYRERNRDRLNAYARALYAKSERRRKLLKRYGMTPDEYDAMYEAQGGRCAICNRHETECQRGQLQVDHCHETGVVRGLLCGLCNTAIGKMGDDPERLIVAAHYLRPKVV
jgi:hypothetical protein